MSVWGGGWCYLSACLGVFRSQGLYKWSRRQASACWWGLMLLRAALGWTEHWKPFTATSSFNHEHLWQVCTFPADHGWSLFLPPPTKQDVFACINSNVCDQDWIQFCALFGFDTLLTWFLRLRPKILLIQISFQGNWKVIWWIFIKLGVCVCECVRKCVLLPN